MDQLIMEQLSREVDYYDCYSWWLFMLSKQTFLFDKCTANDWAANTWCLSFCLKFSLILSLGIFLQSCASYGSHAISMRDGLLQGKPDLSISCLASSRIWLLPEKSLLIRRNMPLSREDITSFWSGSSCSAMVSDKSGFPWSKPPRMEVAWLP